MRCNYAELVKLRRSKYISSVKVQPKGVAVNDYSINLGTRATIQDIGSVKTTSWNSRENISESWTKTNLGALCPRRIIIYDGGIRNIDLTFLLGDDFEAALDPTKWAKYNSASPIISGSILTISGSTNQSIGSVGGFPFNSSLIIWCRLTGSTGMFCYPEYYTVRRYGINGAPTSITLGTYSDGWANGTNWQTGITDQTKFYRWELAKNAAGLKLYADGILKTTTNSSIWSPSPAQLLMGAGNHSGDKIECERVMIRRYIPNEPVAGTAQPTSSNRSMCHPLSLARGIRACCA